MDEVMTAERWRARLEHRVHERYGMSLDAFMIAVDTGTYSDDPEAERLAVEIDLLDDARWSITSAPTPLMVDAPSSSRDPI